MRTENERLEQENEKLEQENERLEEENVHLKKELARLKGTNLKERRCLKPLSRLGREQKRRLLKDILGTLKNVADHYDTSVICLSGLKVQLTSEILSELKENPFFSKYVLKGSRKKKTYFTVRIKIEKSQWAKCAT